MERFKEILDAYESFQTLIEKQWEWYRDAFDGEHEYGDARYVRRTFTLHEDLTKSELYVMLFAQFEAEINGRCEKLIHKHKTQNEWLERRSWEAYDEKNIKNIPFKLRLALLLDKGRPIYAAMQKLYLERNAIAHGAKPTLDIEMEDAVMKILAAVAAMEENP